MSRRAKPAKGKAQATRPLAGRSAKSEDPKVGDLEERLTEALAVKTDALKREAEALEQQAATAEILRVISRSPADLQSVFDAIVDSAMRLFRAWSVNVCRFDGELVHLVATRGGPGEAGPSIRGRFPTAPTAGLTVGRCILDRAVIQIDDVEAEVGLVEATREMARARGWRSALAVPMLRDGEPIGAIMVTRKAPGGFEAGSVELLQTFADQAVIAIENVRLFKELAARNRDLTESLEQQTATAEILRVISRSQTDVQPVFDTIVRSAVRLCDGLFGALYQFDGELLHQGAQHNYTPEALEEMRRIFPAPPTRALVVGRAILERAVVHIPDVELDPEWQHPALSRAIGFRSGLFVPMLREGAPIGVIVVTRAEPRPFSDNEIELLKTFADQAVIAIENVRLFNETKEALERQTATAEILRVISSSPTDVQPVFDAIAESALHLCDSSNSVVGRYDGDFLYLAAHAQQTSEAAEALKRAFPMRPNRATASGRAVLEGSVAHIPDVQADPEYEQPLAEALRARVVLAVPMLRDGQPIGTIGVGRLESRPFNDKHIALLQTFADQAVIAIENARLFNETKESLDRQTATSEILGVISSSPTQLQPVFDTIVRNATRLCTAAFGGLQRIQGDRMTLDAQYGVPPDELAILQRDVFPLPISRESATGRAILDRAVVQIRDIREDPDFRTPRLQTMQSFRTILAVPMIREGIPIGALALWRREVQPFSETEIGLVRTFADQAVIAIENVRLFTELQASNHELTTALDTQTATSDILRVISRSQTDVQPVFDAILASAVRLLGAFSGSLTRRAGDQIELVALTSTDDAGDAAVRARYPQPLQSEDFQARALRDRAPLIIADAQTDPRLPEATRAYARARGWRSAVMVPMLRHGEGVGTISVTRRDPGGFTDDEIALLKTFADQAVIAIENVRLFTELETRNRDLTEALDRQTATSEVLRVISRSQTDVQPVFAAILESAVRLCAADLGGICRVEDERLALIAFNPSTPEFWAVLRENYPRPVDTTSLTGRAVVERRVVHVADTDDPGAPVSLTPVTKGLGFRAQLSVPILRDGQPIGVFALQRRAPGPFSDAQIELVQTFADQAVIAIENARLLGELHARTAELTQSVGELRALGEVGQAISSTLDLQTVLSTIVARATQLAGADAGVIYEYDEQREVFMPRATGHLEVAIVDTMLSAPVRKGEGATGRLAEVPEPFQVPDILEAPAESRVRGALVLAGYRALLAVPLVREDHLLGGLTVLRKATGAFTPEVVELLQTFATQSALAIQNARLFLEIEDKSRQLEAASQHKSEFLANMSHELRTPLNAIIGYSEMLQEEAQDLHQDTFIPDLEKINAAAKHQLSLINDILDLSKIEAGRMELELADFHLPSAIENALILVRERASRRGIALGHTIDSALGMARADERKVKQVLLNLLSNALKFTPEGGRIDVRAGVRDDLAEISVADTGVGIAPEDQEAVFEEFRQVGTAAKKVEGTGLGLALSRKFVELHGGRIWVTSQLGEGSTFTFTLPVRRETGMGA